MKIKFKKINLSNYNRSGDWGLGIGPNPQSPIPNPQSPIPIILKIKCKKDL